MSIDYEAIKRRADERIIEVAKFASCFRDFMASHESLVTFINKAIFVKDALNDLDAEAREVLGTRELQALQSYLNSINTFHNSIDTALDSYSRETHRELLTKLVNKTKP